MNLLADLEAITGTGDVGVYIYPNGNRVYLQHETTSGVWVDAVSFTQDAQILLTIESGASWRVNYKIADSASKVYTV
jgi:hypothetical protein